MTHHLVNDNELVFVDDDDTELLLARKYHERSRVPNSLLTFASGEAFLVHMRRLADEPERMPAMVLLDGRMPTMSGVETIEALRATPAFDELPKVVLFSNSDEPSDIERALEAGADAYVVKPSSGRAYLDFLNSLVPEPATP